MANMTSIEIKNIVKNLYKGQCGVNVVVELSCDNSMNKGTKNNRNPYLGRLTKPTLICGCRLGCEYKHYNEKELERLKNEKKPYNTENLKGMWWDEYPFFKKSNNGDFLSFNYRDSDNVEWHNRYFLDGAEINQNTYNGIIAQWGKNKSTYHPKQALYGLVNEEIQTKVVNYNFNYILHIGTNKVEAMKIFNS